MNADGEPPGYARCIECNRQWESRYVNDIGICTRCRLTHVLVTPNPIYDETPENP